MKYKKLLSICICICFVYLIYGCKKEINENFLIISSDKDGIVNYYKYNTKKEKCEKVYSVEKTCYPTATLSKNDDILYFTKNDVNGSAQLFEKNIDNNIEKQLTSKEEDGIINIDFLRINYKKNVIYLRVVQEGHINFNLAIYKIETGELEILDQNEVDLSSQFIDFNNYYDSVLILQNSEEEKFKVMDSINKTKNMSLVPKNNIILEDDTGMDKEYYGVVNNNVVDISLSSDGQEMLILTEEMNEGYKEKFKKQVWVKNLKSDEFESVLDNSNFYYDISQISFDSYGRGFYFVASEIKDDSLQKKLYYYDFKTKKSSEKVKCDKENIISCIRLNKIDN